MFSGKRFLTDKSGKSLVDPNTTFIISGEGVVRAGDILMDLDIKATANKWPSLSLAQGVEKQGDLYVVSDPTCGYCQKVDEEAQEYLDNGIQVHYIPYPRSGLGTDFPGYQKWAAALCSDNPAKAYHAISAGKGSDYPVPTDLNAPCTDLIEAGYKFGQMIGVEGTPYMYGINVNGTIFKTPGYVPVKDFSAKIGIFIKDTGASALLN
jgi:hypothetical protein